MGVRVLLGPLGLGLVSCIQVHQRRRLVITIIGIDVNFIFVFVLCFVYASSILDLGTVFT